MTKPILRNALWLTLAATLAACGNSQPIPPAQSAGQQPINKTNGEGLKSSTPSSWFVQLAGAPTSGGISAQSVLSAQSQFRSLAKEADIQYQEKYAYTSLFNGFSVRANDSAISKISQLPGVVAIYPVEKADIPQEERTPVLAQPDLSTAIAQTGVDIVQSTLKLTGKGIKVGVVDSGIDLDHPAFKDKDGKSRVVAQYDFVGDDYGVKDSYIPKPDDNADACDGHGTHVAGIVGGSDTIIKGVAPEVSFGAYKVFGCSGGTQYDVWVAAMERAAADGMNIITMSIGGFGGVPGNPVYQAIQRLNEKGIFVVKSGGNNGDKGLFASDGTGAAPGALTVASFDNTFKRLGKLKVDGKSYSFAFSDAPKIATFKLASTGQPPAQVVAPQSNDGCNKFPANTFKDRWVLIQRGTCTFQTKVDNVKTAGALGIVIYNRPGGGEIFGPSVDGLPIVMVSYADGLALFNALGAGPLNGEITAEFSTVKDPNGNLLSSFSSYGPTAELKFKPDLGAPGGNIFSSYPLEKGGYAILSGTSMATPHVAGILALMLEANPNLKFDEARARLQNTAVPQLWSGNPSLDLLDAVQRQGAGMANAVGAIQSKVVVTPSALGLGDSKTSGNKQTLTLKNTGTEAVTYTLDHVDAININNPVKANLDYGDTTVTFSSSSVTVPAGGTTTVDVTIDAPSDQFAKNTVYGGYLTLTPSAGSVVHVPYMGFKGDFQSIKALASGGLFYQADNGDLFRQKADTVFELTDGDFPAIGFNLNYPVQKAVVEILDGNSYIPLFSQTKLLTVDGLGRNQDGTSFDTFVWDGSLKAYQVSAGLPVTKTAPNGRYALRVRVLKMLGDANNPAHWESYSTPPFFVIKPSN